MGIGGEYSAVNSAIDEVMAGKHRGRVELAINGTYWAGAAIGAFASSILLDTDRFGVDRLAHRLLHRPRARARDHLPPAAHP